MIYRKYLCGEGYFCTQGGQDGVCCISCNGVDACKEPCNTAEILKKNRLKGYKPDRCEHMLEENPGIWVAKEVQA